MNDHLQRMLIERYELYAKELALEKFINENPIFEKLSNYKKELMAKQLNLMTQYRETLEERIKAEEQ